MVGGDELIVIGGGLAGLSAAHELLQRGHRVRVVEAREDVGLETSFANGGLLTPSMSDPWNGPGVHRHLISSLTGRDSAMKLRLSAVPSLMTWGVDFLLHSRTKPHRAATIATFRLATYSLQALRTLRDTFALDFDYAARGTMKVFRSEAAMRASAGIAGMLREEGLSFEILDPEAAVRVEPQLADVRDKIVGAIFNPGDGCGDAFKFCRTLAARIETTGGRIQRNCFVRRLIVDKGRAVGVELLEGVIRGRGVVVAAGGTTRRLASAIGVRLSIQPAKGYSLTFAVDPAVLPRIPVIDDALHAAATPLGSRLRVAGTAEFAGYDTSIGPDRMANLLRVLTSLYPGLASAAEFSSARPWAGLRPMSSDGLPYIGPGRIPGMWVSGGHGHLGWTLATGSARLLADLIENRVPEIDPRPYRVDR